MNHSLPKYLFLTVLFSGIALGDEIIREVPDNTAGRGYGALTGMMAGAAGGPIGAVAGAGVGFWISHSIQQTAGLSDIAYEVRDAEGELKTVRSPNAHFTVSPNFATFKLKMQDHNSLNLVALRPTAGTVIQITFIQLVKTKVL